MEGFVQFFKSLQHLKHYDKLTVLLSVLDILVPQKNIWFDILPECFSLLDT